MLNPNRKRRRKSNPGKVLLSVEYQADGPGAATVYDPRYAKVALWAQTCYGGTKQELADYLNIEIVTLHRWAAEHEEFRNALMMSPELADIEVVASLRHRAVGYSHEAVKIFMVKEQTFRVDPETGEEVRTVTERPVLVPYIEHYPPDTSAAFIWLKNRRPDEWRDRIEHVGADGGPITFTLDIGQARGAEPPTLEADAQEVPNAA